jgi:hypothetical protein
LLVNESITIVIDPIEAIIKDATATLIYTGIDTPGTLRTVRISTDASLADFGIP